MALLGYPGIHAGMPTTQCLRSALVVNGAPKIKSQSKAKQSKAKQSKAVLKPTCFSPPYLDSPVGAGLPAKAA
ncbi:hypothetical protein [Pseudomonas sp. SMN5]|uniref:hypothetical protein n=1 Tax=Pseudomonas sp. SMN5 TaxID=3390198 RepID=UPI003F84F9BE